MVVVVVIVLQALQKQARQLGTRPHDLLGHRAGLLSAELAVAPLLVVADRLLGIQYLCVWWLWHS